MSPQAEWLLVNEIQPRIGSAVQYAVNHSGCEDARELTQDGLCMAAKMLTQAEHHGKQVTPGNIAYYTLQHLKSGRRSYGSSVIDPLHPMTQIQGKSRVCFFEDVVKADEEGGEPIRLEEVLSVDAEDPSMAAARNLDWEAFLAGLNACSRSILECLLENRPLFQLAEELKLSVSTLQHHKRRLAQQITAFMGAEVLKDCARRPMWRNNLHAIHEKMACLDERHA